MTSCLAKVPIFQQLSEKEQASIHEFIRPKTFKKGQFIQLAGDYNPELLILNRGAVKISRTSDDGDEQLLRTLSPGDYIGDLAVFVNAPAGYDAIALTDSSFCTLNSQHLHDLLRSHPELGLKIIADLSSKLNQAETKIESLTLKSADERLLQSLHQTAAGANSFKLDISKKDLASQIGVRPETLSRSFRSLEQKGLVAVSGKQIQLLADGS